MSLWLRLLPQLDQGSSSGGHLGQNQLIGPTWGVARNVSGQPGVTQMSLGDAAMCSADFQSASHLKYVDIKIIISNIFSKHFYAFKMDVI